MLLGIDTGGTYTDAVLLDEHSSAVVCSTKTLTTHDDFSRGIAGAIDQIGATGSSSIAMVSISTTLATNAIVERQGGRVCLLLLGYDQEVVERFGLEANFATDLHFYIRGGHDIGGGEKCALDERHIVDIVHSVKDTVDAFAVSGYSSIRDPSHELRCRELIRSICDVPVVCGHELSDRLNSVKRATTAALNARLIPIIHRLLNATQKALLARGITAPLYVVKGDGTLMNLRAAALRPIETILSGPAASVVGAKHLAGTDDCLVADMGGTTTDICLLRDGQLSLNADGAEIEGRQTNVRAGSVRTLGLGGNSLIRVGGDGRLSIGPRSVTPLALGAEANAGVQHELRRLARQSGSLGTAYDATFYVRDRDIPPGMALTREEELALRLLEEGAASLSTVSRVLKKSHPVLLDLSRLESQRIVALLGLTPTDVLHVEGSDLRGDSEAAATALSLICKAQGKKSVDLVKWIREEISKRLWFELLQEGLGLKLKNAKLHDPRSFNTLLEMAFGTGDAGIVDVNISLRIPIVAVGAPAHQYFPQVARRLGTEAIVPTQHEVAGAIGSAVGNVLQEATVELSREIQPDGGLSYVVRWLGGMKRANDDKDALALARDKAVSLASELVRRSGGESISVDVSSSEFRQGHYFHAKIRAVAVGKPRIYDRNSTPQRPIGSDIPANGVSVRHIDI